MVLQSLMELMLQGITKQFQIILLQIIIVIKTIQIQIQEHKEQNLCIITLHQLKTEPYTRAQKAGLITLTVVEIKFTLKIINL